MNADMMFDAVYGKQEYPTIPAEQWSMLHESVVRSSIQYYTIQGYLSELRVFEYLCSLPNVTCVRKVPDYSYGHGGDVSFKYKGKTYTMEVKTLSKDEGSVAIAPTRKSDEYKAYRVGTFDLVGVCISQRRENALLFVHIDSLPRHRKSNEFLATRIKVSADKNFAPFVHDIRAVL